MKKVTHNLAREDEPVSDDDLAFLLKTSSVESLLAWTFLLGLLEWVEVNHIQQLVDCPFAYQFSHCYHGHEPWWWLMIMSEEWCVEMIDDEWWRKM